MEGAGIVPRLSRLHAAPSQFLFAVNSVWRRRCRAAPWAACATLGSGVGSGDITITIVAIRLVATAAKGFKCGLQYFALVVLKSK
jgi:hypothetical protein